MKSLMVCLMSLLVFVQAGAAQQATVAGQVRLSGGLPVAEAQVMLFDLSDLRRGVVAAGDDGCGRVVCAAAGGLERSCPTAGLCARGELPQSVQSCDDYPLRTGGDLTSEIRRVQRARAADGYAGGWRAGGRGLSGAMGWHGCVGAGRGRGRVSVSADGGFDKLSRRGVADGADGAGGWAGGCADAGDPR